MEGKELKSGADASQGTSKRHRVKHKRASRKQSDGKLGIVKCSMIKKKHVSGEQQKTNVSEIPQVEHGEVEKKGFQWVSYARNATQQDTGGGCNYPRKTMVTNPRGIALVKSIKLKRAETALKYYAKGKDDEFEVLEVLDYNGTELRHPELCPDYKSDKLWVHISFTAKSKNANSSDDSPKLFFGEISRRKSSGEFQVAFCSTFEPSDDSGFDHGCVFCPPNQKLHPADGYIAGRPPWYIPRIKHI